MNVSVVIPTYNRAAMLQQALRSVRRQTHGPLEVIVVDDGSDDGTAQVVDGVRDIQVKYVRHDRTLGASAARNSGLRVATGDYIAFLDSDDEWFPAKIKRQLDVFRRSPPQTGLVYCGIEYVYAGPRQRRVLPRYRGRMLNRLVVDNVVGSTSVGLVRRDVFNVVGGFDETFEALQDADLWLRISRRFMLDFVPDVLVRVNMHDGAERISRDTRRRLRARETFYAKHRELITAAGLAHRYHTKTARIWLRQARNRRASREHALRAIRMRRVSPVGYLSYAATFIPESAFSAGGAVRRALRAAGTTVTAFAK